MGRNRKVVAYITREVAGKRQLLVMLNAGQENPGLQVPGGTIIDGESEEEALLREIREESGLTRVRIVRKLGQDKYFNERRKIEVTRSYYHLQSDEPRDTFTHVVDSKDDDNGSVYRYHWIDLDGGELPALYRGNFVRDIGPRD